MKKSILSFLAFMLFFCSCTNSSNNNISNTNDNVTEEVKEEPQVPTGIVLSDQEADSLALIAWGDLRFGMSKKEAKKSVVFKNGSSFETTLSSDIDYQIALQNSLKLEHWFTVWGEFKGNKVLELTKVRIDGGSYNYNEMHALSIDCVKLITRFSETYGKPNYLYNGEISTEILDKNKITLADWKIGKSMNENGLKEIRIHAEHYVDLSYRYVINITNDAFPKDPKKPTSAELKAEQERQKRTKEAINNAF